MELEQRVKNLELKLEQEKEVRRIENIQRVEAFESNKRELERLQFRKETALRGNFSRIYKKQIEDEHNKWIDAHRHRTGV